MICVSVYRYIPLDCTSTFLVCLMVVYMFIVINMMVSKYCKKGEKGYNAHTRAHARTNMLTVCGRVRCVCVCVVPHYAFFVLNVRPQLMPFHSRS